VELLDAAARPEDGRRRRSTVRWSQRVRQQLDALTTCGGWRLEDGPAWRRHGRTRTTASVVLEVGRSAVAASSATRDRAEERA
jgi:hypothetical protein